MKEMQRITVKCPSGSRKFTLVGPPFVQLGDEIKGYGIVTKAKMTTGITIPASSVLVGLFQSDRSQDSRPEAKS